MVSSLFFLALKYTTHRNLWGNVSTFYDHLYSYSYSIFRHMVSKSTLNILRGKGKKIFLIVDGENAFLSFHYNEWYGRSQIIWVVNIILAISILDFFFLFLFIPTKLIFFLIPFWLHRICRSENNSRISEMTDITCCCYSFFVSLYPQRLVSIDNNSDLTLWTTSFT